jgi:hypothetical protein
VVERGVRRKPNDGVDGVPGPPMFLCWIGVSSILVGWGSRLNAAGPATTACRGEAP